eukprot:gene21358-biopygen1103
MYAELYRAPLSTSTHSTIDARSIALLPVVRTSPRRPATPAPQAQAPFLDANGVTVSIEDFVSAIRSLKTPLWRGFLWSTSGPALPRLPGACMRGHAGLQTCKHSRTGTDKSGLLRSAAAGSLLRHFENWELSSTAVPALLTLWPAKHSSATTGRTLGHFVIRGNYVPEIPAPPSQLLFCVFSKPSASHDKKGHVRGTVCSEQDYPNAQGSSGPEGKGGLLRTGPMNVVQE